VAGRAIFDGMAGDARAHEDARAVRGHGISMVAVGLWAGGLTFGRGMAERDWVAFVVALAVLVGLVLVAKFALGVRVWGPQAEARPLRRATTTAYLATVVALPLVNVFDTDMHGDVLFWAVAALVVAAPAVGVGWWTLLRVPSVEPVGDGRRD
jgi:hypothetical protein